MKTENMTQIVNRLSMGALCVLLINLSGRQEEPSQCRQRVLGTNETGVQTTSLFNHGTALVTNGRSASRFLFDMYVSFIVHTWRKHIYVKGASSRPAEPTNAANQIV